MLDSDGWTRNNKPKMVLVLPLESTRTAADTTKVLEAISICQSTLATKTDMFKLSDRGRNPV